ncbi:translation machinery-associated protein 22, partial [Emergomyces africanus]
MTDTGDHEAAAAPPEPQARHIVYCGETITANLNTLSLSARERAAKDAAKKEAKAALAETRNQERKAAAKIQIRRVERNKRKYVTVVSGLEAHGLENKKIAKELGKKFATGSSVTKAVSGVAATAQGALGRRLRSRAMLVKRFWSGWWRIMGRRCRSIMLSLWRIRRRRLGRVDNCLEELRIVVAGGLGRMNIIGKEGVRIIVFKMFAKV